ncbi:MAG: hypothetical protein ABH952_04430 [Candidatus Omnitrophota bacterium]
MQKFGKLGIIFLIFISIIAISAAVALYTIKEDERNKRITAENKNTDLTAQKKKLERNLNETMEIKDKLQVDLAEQRLKAQQLAAQLEEELIEKENLQAQISAKEQETANLKDKIKNERETKLKLTNELSKTKREHSKLQNEYDQLRMAKEALEEKISARRTNGVVGLEKIVVMGKDGKLVSQPALSEELLQALNGEVLVVNKEFSFVVINLGNRDGLGQEMLLGIFRDDKLLAKVQVERIFDNMASAIILPEYNNVELKEGDRVKPI